jgi:DNA-binding Lrp family transcriptional regulator
MPSGLDPLDLKILKILLVDYGVPPGVPVFRKSFRSMAKVLEVDQATIRRRIKRFQEQRILKG